MFACLVYTLLPQFMSLSFSTIPELSSALSWPQLLLPGFWGAGPAGNKCWTSCVLYSLKGPVVSNSVLNWSYNLESETTCSNFSYYFFLLTIFYFCFECLSPWISSIVKWGQYKHPENIPEQHSIILENHSESVMHCAWLCAELQMSYLLLDLKQYIKRRHWICWVYSYESFLKMNVLICLFLSSFLPLCLLCVCIIALINSLKLSNNLNNS